MEDQKDVIQNETRGNNTIKILGIIVFIVACLASISAAMLDLAGEQAVGKVSNAATNCSGGKTCWTGKVEFTTTNGESIIFYPFTAPMLFDADPFLSGRSYEDYSNYQVRYLAAYPQFAKVKLAYFLEYTTHISGLCLGGFLLLIGSAFSGSKKPNKPLVLDLSSFRKKGE
jgi:hypothetical protein